MRFEYPDVVPLAVQSARFVNRGASVISYQPARVRNYKKLIGEMTRNQMVNMGVERIRTPIIIRSLTFIFAPPAKMKISKLEILREYGLYKRTKPDLDNLMKGFLDGIKGVLIEDDNQIVEIGAAKKVYSEDDKGIIMTIETVPPTYYL